MLPHVVPEKSAAFAPWMAICRMFIIVELLLVSVITCGGLLVLTGCAGKVRLVGERLSAVPTPVRITTCGLLAALSLMTMDDLLGPAAVGANVT